jgi:two-component system, NtrC family, sensor kinase
LQHRLKPNGNRSGIQVVREYGELPLVECYAGQLNQVFMNILSNAIDALEDSTNSPSAQSAQQEPPTITIHTNLQTHNPLRHSGAEVSTVVIRIADNGVGIPESVRSRLFDPFFTTKPVGQGTGLGLSISYQIVVERHGGVLQCIPRPGGGAEFWIEIPFQGH